MAGAGGAALRDDLLGDASGGAGDELVVADREGVRRRRVEDRRALQRLQPGSASRRLRVARRWASRTRAASRSSSSRVTWRRMQRSSGPTGRQTLAASSR